MCFYSLKYIYLIVLGLTVTFRGELEGAWKTCSGESAAEGKTLEVHVRHMSSWIFSVCEGVMLFMS